MIVRCERETFFTYHTPHSPYDPPLPNPLTIFYSLLTFLAHSCSILLFNFVSFIFICSFIFISTYPNHAHIPRSYFKRPGLSLGVKIGISLAVEGSVAHTYRFYSKTYSPYTNLKIREIRKKKKYILTCQIRQSLQSMLDFTTDNIFGI